MIFSVFHMVEGKLITYGKTIEHKTEKMEISLDIIENNKNIDSVKSQLSKEK